LSVSCVWIDQTGRLRRSSAAAPSKFGIACSTHLSTQETRETFF
jgi:hypothetical protein